MGGGVASFLLLPPHLPHAVSRQPHSFRLTNRQVLFFQRGFLGCAIAFLDARQREASRHERKTRKGSYKNRQSGFGIRCCYLRGTFIRGLLGDGLRDRSFPQLWRRQETDLNSRSDQALARRRER